MPSRADVADREVADLVWVLDVPVGMRDDGDSAGVVDQLDGLFGGRPPARDERLRARHQVLLEERAEVGAGAGGLGDVRAADRVGGAGLGDRLLEVDVHPVLVELGDDLLGADRPAPAGRGRTPARSSPGRPSTRRCGGPPSTCGRTTSPSPGRSRCRPRRDSPPPPRRPRRGGERHHRHPRLGGGTRRRRRARADRRRRSNVTEDRSASPGTLDQRRPGGVSPAGQAAARAPR